MLCYKFRLYPSKAVESTLAEHLEICRRLYNRLLEMKKNSRNQEPGHRSLQSLLVDLKKNDPELQKLYSKVLQMVNNQLHYNLKVLSTLKKRGKRVGSLRFKGEGRYNTLNYNQSGFSIDFENKKLHLSKIGRISIKLHRNFEGNVKGLIVKRSGTGRWFAIFQVDESRAEPLPAMSRAVGIDVGVRHFLTDSDGRQIENPRFYGRALKRMRILQRSFSRKKNGSSNRRKAVMRLNNAYEKLASQRDDFLHKLSRFYVDNYDVIITEDLKIQKMARSRNYGRFILDAGWSRFFRMLSYKAASAGRTVVKVNPAYTSQENEDKMEDRDFRASINILNRGLSGLGRPSVPVEIRPLQVIPASLIVETGSPIPSG